MLLSGSPSCSLFVTQNPKHKKPHKPPQTWLPCPDKVLTVVDISDRVLSFGLGASVTYPGKGGGHQMKCL